MPGPALAAHEISKRYVLGSGVRGYRTVREAVTTAVSGAVRRAASGGPGPAGRRTHIWALRDVSFEVAPGELVGIIGRNGAGKTTVLKILSRITKPTSGRAEVRGRVGSLLEVGTGSHPELTGRENVYLSGAILGMSKAEIKRRFDEIVEFADIGDFLDTPIKRYSSGMKVRLAFAVAAHLEPEILIVDEVLAVGDAAFQRKCLGKMGDVTAEGRTVLFVSHNMAVIQGLCRRGIFLENGSIVTDASIEDAVRAYLRRLEENVSEDLLVRTDRRGRQGSMLSRVEVEGPDGTGRLVTGSPARFRFHVTDLLSRMSCKFTIYNHLGQPVGTLVSEVPTAADRYERDGKPFFECLIDELPLVPGRYRIDVVIKGRRHLQDDVEAAAVFDVDQGLLRGRPVVGNEGYGNVAIAHRWRVPEAERS
jgi:lipopolysaccharide transport system ATP-binding protein